jgi:hypothetical protein
MNTIAFIRVHEYGYAAVTRAVSGRRCAMVGLP